MLDALFPFPISAVREALYWIGWIVFACLWLVFATWPALAQRIQRRAVRARPMLEDDTERERLASIVNLSEWRTR